MGDTRRHRVTTVMAAVVILGATAFAARGDDPPALNPFGTQEAPRDDAVPGYLELSDGSVHLGLIYLTRDARLKVYDDQEKRARELPLRAVKRVDATVDREWLEKEWRFRENANDAKVYTGRAYPAREYSHTIVLTDGRTIHGALSGIVYVRPEGVDDTGARAERFLLHKRDKGEPGTDLNSLTYVRTVRLGPDARAEGLLKFRAKTRTGTSKPKPVKKGARPPDDGPTG